MGSIGRQRALNEVIRVHGAEIREEVELRAGDTELLADAVITDLDGTEARLGVA